jgi:hypothetical protein
MEALKDIGLIWILAKPCMKWKKQIDSPIKILTKIVK